MAAVTIQRITPYPREAFTRDDATDPEQTNLRAFIQAYPRGDVNYSIDGEGNTTVLLRDDFQQISIHDGDTVFKEPWADYWTIKTSTELATDYEVV